MKKNQRGYLLLVAVILIVVVGFIGNIVVYMFMGKTKSTRDVLLSDQALYIALSGLEIAKRDFVSGVKCTAINGLAKYTNASLFSGTFTVTGAANQVATLLQSTITSTATSIPLISTAGFANMGVISIDSEVIRYVGISGNILTNATRGAEGTTSASHLAGVSVVENQCTITAVGGVPTIAGAEGKRSLQQVILASAGLSAGGATPALAVGGNVSLSGTPFVINPSITPTSSDFAGSTIVSNGTVSMNGSGGTEVGNGSGGLIVSSTPGNYNPDIMQNNSYVAPSGLFSEVFGVTQAVMKAGADNVFNPLTSITQLNGLNGKTIWIDGDVSEAGNTAATVGTLNNPSIVIINGNLDLKGSSQLQVEGILYVIGSVTMKGTADLGGAGQTIVQGNLDMKGSGTVTFDTAVLSKLNLIESNTNTSYSGSNAGTQEIFP